MRILLGMYSSVVTSVKLHNGITPFFKSHIGVKQGCNLSPTRFNIFVYDRPSLSTNSCVPVKLGETNLNCLVYADDVVLSESQAGLQKCLTKLKLYTKRWKLKINYKKSKIIVLGTATQRRTFLTSKWFYDNNILEHGRRLYIFRYQYSLLINVLVVINKF